jgi:hypothetical protein
MFLASEFHAMIVVALVVTYQAIVKYKIALFKDFMDNCI